MGIEEFVFGSESACHVASDIFRDLLNSATRTVKLWDVQTGQMVRRIVFFCELGSIMKHVTRSSDKSNCFKGRTPAVELGPSG